MKGFLVIFSVFPNIDYKSCTDWVGLFWHTLLKFIEPSRWKPRTQVIEKVRYLGSEIKPIIFKYGNIDEMEEFYSNRYMPDCFCMIPRSITRGTTTLIFQNSRLSKTQLVIFRRLLHSACFWIEILKNRFMPYYPVTCLSRTAKQWPLIDFVQTFLCSTRAATNQGPYSTIQLSDSVTVRLHAVTQFIVHLPWLKGELSCFSSLYATQLCNLDLCILLSVTLW